MLERTHSSATCCRLGLLIFLFLLIFCAIGYAVETETKNACKFSLQTPNSTEISKTLIMGEMTELEFPAGESTLRLSCQSVEQGVITFHRTKLMQFEWLVDNKTQTAFTASQHAYLIASNRYEAQVNFIHTEEDRLEFQWEPLPSYMASSQRHNVVLGIFYGLCVTLIMYVLVLGRNLKDDRFLLYGIYVACAGTFFLLQEGHLNLFFNNIELINNAKLDLLFAGLTVFSATFFIVRLFDMDKIWQWYARYMLIFPAGVVLLASIIILFSKYSPVLEEIMAWLSLYVVAAVFASVGYASYIKIHTARLVLFALSLVLFSMVFRVLLNDISPFLHRYALIISFSIESFILAVATAEQIKFMNQRRIIAEDEAISDPLCDVLNRRGWENKANLLLKDHELQSGYLCLLYIDLNKFKKINDEHGHHIGDEVLQVVAKIIQNKTRDADAAATGRLGGDEFVVLAHFNTRNQCDSIITRMSDRLHDLKVRTSATTLTVSASIGSVIFASPPKSVDDLLKHGDKAMYQAKSNYHSKA